MNYHDTKLEKFFAERDTQGAAEYIASLRGIKQQNAMDAATKMGFTVEFYANSIRVTIPGRGRQSTRRRHAGQADRGDGAPRTSTRKEESMTKIMTNAEIAALVAKRVAAGHARWVPCPDHRDKVDYRNACPQCSIERLVKALRKVQDLSFHVPGDTGDLIYKECERAILLEPWKVPT